MIQIKVLYLILGGNDSFCILKEVEFDLPCNLFYRMNLSLVNFIFKWAEFPCGFRDLVVKLVTLLSEIRMLTRKLAVESWGNGAVGVVSYHSYLSFLE